MHKIKDFLFAFAWYCKNVKKCMNDVIKANQIAYASLARWKIEILSSKNFFVTVQTKVNSKIAGNCLWKIALANFDILFQRYINVEL